MQVQCRHIGDSRDKKEEMEARNPVKVNWLNVAVNWEEGPGDGQAIDGGLKGQAGDRYAEERLGEMLDGPSEGAAS